MLLAPLHRADRFTEVLQDLSGSLALTSSEGRVSKFTTLQNTAAYVCEMLLLIFLYL